MKSNEKPLLNAKKVVEWLSKVENLNKLLTIIIKLNKL